MIETRIGGFRRPDLKAVHVTGGFWKGKIDLAAHDMIPHQWDALSDRIPGVEPSHALENFRIAGGEAGGRFYGNIFQDSDVAKWLEAASYGSLYEPDPRTEAHADEAVRLIAKAQRPDGYLNTYFTVAAPDKRWTDLAWAHELYCMGHLIEAAVARFQAAGKRDLLEVMCRAADHIDGVFGPGEGLRRGCCGHPEIELALFKLWRATGEVRYRNLALHFLSERGTDPESFRDQEPLVSKDLHKTRWYMSPDYFSAHMPVRQQRDAEGHAVRAMYLYSAMADAYAETRDPELLAALSALWDSVVSRRMYITGGIGSQAHAERFTIDFDLPSDTAYAETCACIGFALWAGRMSAIEADSRYADAVERALYNGILSGVSADGTRYFYVNPLEVTPSVAAARFDHAHIKTERVPWLGCSCCPPNIARLIGQIGSFIYTYSGDEVWVHQYMESEAAIAPGAAIAPERALTPGAALTPEAGGLRLAMETAYPWDGRVRITLKPDRPRDMTLHLRIPGWCESFTCTVNGALLQGPRLTSGYLEVRRLFSPGDVIELSLDMPVRFIEADPRVAELAGRAAIQRGPLVYCLESVDNGPDLHQIVLDPSGPVSVEEDPGLLGGMVRVEASGFRVSARQEDGRPGGLYRAYGSGTTSFPVRLRAVPYHLWGNRAPGGEMRVWLRVADRGN